MARKNKKFDCVEMKNRIQKKLRAEKAKFSSEEEYRKHRLDKLMKDKDFAELLRNVKRAGAA